MLLLPHHSVKREFCGIWLTMMPSRAAFRPFHWGCQQCWQHLHEPGAGCSLLFFAGGTEMSELQQKTAGPSNLMVEKLKSIGITANQWFSTTKGNYFRWSLELHNLWIAPVPCSQYVCVQLGCGLRVATSSYFGFCSNSWPIFPRMLVSARTWNSKADSEEAISRLYIRFRIYTKLSRRPNMHAPGTQKKAPLWLWLRLAKGLQWYFLIY